MVCFFKLINTMLSYMRASVTTTGTQTSVYIRGKGGYMLM